MYNGPDAECIKCGRAYNSGERGAHPKKPVCKLCYRSPPPKSGTFAYAARVMAQEIKKMKREATKNVKKLVGQ